MRFVLWLGLTLFFVSFGYIGSDLLSELAARTEARDAQTRVERDRVMRVLKTHERYGFYQVVISPGTGADEIEFRGRARRDDITLSTYGTVRMTCTPPADRADCWELASLYIDGVEVDQTAGEAVPGTAAEDPQAAVSPAPAEETPGIVTLQPLPIEPDSEATPAPAAPVAEIQRPTHVVRPSLVNARETPQGVVLTTLEGGTPLVLLEQDGGWGLFRVQGGGESGLEVWIAFSVLDAV